MLKVTKVLEQEQEFIKINEKLDLETQHLFKKLHEAVNNDNTNPLIMSTDNLKASDETPVEDDVKNTDSESNQRRILSNSAKENGKIERSRALLSLPQVTGDIHQAPKLTRHKSEVGVKERLDSNGTTGGAVPEVVKSLGNESVMRFLKAKVQILTEQMENMKKVEKKMIEKVKELQVDRERVSEDRDKWIQQANIAKNMLVKHEHHASDLVLQLQSIQTENNFLKKEVEKLKKDLKQVSQGAGSNEVRLNRANEEVERLKNTVKQMKQDEKDLRENQKKKVEDMNIHFKRLEKQKIELLHAFKKQLIVIDGLKKQRGLAEAGKLLKAIEDDFMEFLDWNPNKN